MEETGGDGFLSGIGAGGSEGIAVAVIGAAVAVAGAQEQPVAGLSHLVEGILGTISVDITHQLLRRDAVYHE
ncbi:hypothetical protein D3C81_2083810 [compost metagenome]